MVLRNLRSRSKRARGKTGLSFFSMKFFRKIDVLKVRCLIVIEIGVFERKRLLRSNVIPTFVLVVLSPSFPLTS